MNLLDMIKREKEIHDKAMELKYNMQPKGEPDTMTDWKCLNIARDRMNQEMKMNTMEKSFMQALESAHGTEIFSVWEEGDDEQWKVIVRNLKDNWQQDTKYINAPKGVGFEVGNTITWTRLQSRWLVVWQDYNKADFFRGEIQKATHMLKWKNKAGQVQEKWAVVQGPVETKAKYEQTRGESIVGRQNDTLEIWLGRLKNTDLNDLRRFQKIRVGNRVWRIHVVDDISNDKILRLSCIEDFVNPSADDPVLLLPNGLNDYAPNEEEPGVESAIRIVGPALIPEKLVSTFYAIDEESSSKLHNVSWTAVSESGDQVVVEIIDNEFDIKGTKVGDKITITCEDLNTRATNSITVKVKGMLKK